MLKTDFNVMQFAAFLEMLEPFPKLTAELDTWGTREQSQKAHMVLWFQAQTGTGSGAYSRAVGNTSAKSCYNHLLNTGALVWIADALGENPETVRRAVRESIKAERINYRRRCTAFRAVIPWRRICELVENPHGWRFDPALSEFITWKDNVPIIKPNKRTQFRKVIEKQL